MSTDTAKAVPRSNVVLLGASNLSLGWPRLAEQVAQTVAPQWDVFTAHGMGRSYCSERSGFAFWQLPGILKCGIWDRLTESSDREADCYALITDLGNDLVYGKTPTEVTQAASECVERLRRWNPDCRIVMTRPPTASVDTVGWLRFAVCRIVLFPKCPLTLAEVKAATVELDDRLVSLAATLDVEITGPQPDWYGLDPIHVKRKFQGAAFRLMVERWHAEQLPAAEPAVCSEFRRRPKANMYWRFGRKRLVAQPSVVGQSCRVFAF